MFQDYLKLLMRKDNTFVCFRMSSLNHHAKVLLHRSTTLQQNNGSREKKKYCFSHFVLADVSILLQWQLLIAK